MSSAPPADARPGIGLPRALGPLADANFALSLVGVGTASVSRWIEITGAVWLMYELTGSPVLLGLLGVARAVPAILVAPLGGAIADRIDERKLLLTVQGLGFATSLGLGVVVLTGRVEFWHLYVQGACQASIFAFSANVRNALFPRLLPRSSLPEAAVLTVAAGRVAAFVGPVIGGFAIARLGVASPFLLGAAVFPVVTVAVTLIRDVAPRGRTTSTTLRGDLVEGLRYITATPLLSGLLKLEVAFSVFSMNPVMILIIGRQVLGVDPQALGGLLAAPGLGSVLGLVCLFLLGQTNRQGRFVVLCVVAYAVLLMTFAVSTDYATSFATLAVIGLLDVFATVTRFTVMQLAAPGPMRGRVLGNMAAVSSTGPLAETQSGSLAAAFGGPLAVIAAAGALAATAVALAATNSALWGFSREDVHREPAAPASSGPQHRVRP